MYKIISYDEMNEHEKEALKIKVGEFTHFLDKWVKEYYRMIENISIAHSRKNEV